MYESFLTRSSLPLLASVAWPAVSSLTLQTWLSTLSLGTVHTGLAWFLCYNLLGSWGARASLVTYAMPPVGMLLGAIVLGEPVDWRLGVGGIVLARSGRWPWQAAPDPS